MRIIDLVYVEFSLRMTKVELLFKIIILIDVLCLLDGQIVHHSVYLVFQVIAKMFAMVDPGQRITTEHHLLEFSLSGSESQTLFYILLDLDRY